MDLIFRQKQHHRPDTENPLELLGNLPGFALGYPLDLAKLTGVFFHHVQRIFPKPVHNTARQSRPDPLDRACGQIFVDCPCRSGQLPFIDRYPKLTAKGRMGHIISSENQFFPFGNAGHFTHHGDQFVCARQFQHGKTAFFLLVNDMFHRAGQAKIFLCFHSPSKGRKTPAYFFI